MSCTAGGLVPVPTTCPCDPALDFECDPNGFKDCGSTVLNNIFAIVPDQGVMASQFNGLLDACYLLGLPTSRTRQQSYVNMHGQSAGASCDFVVGPTRTSIFGASGSTFEHRNGTTGPMVESALGENSPRYTYAIVGNTLANPKKALVKIAEKGFLSGGNCGSDILAERLYKAIRLVEVNGGDLRCVVPHWE